MPSENHSRVTQREARDDDEPFLYRLYESTRAEEMAAWGWDTAQQEMFLKLQFTAQRRHYDIAFPGSDHRIIVRNGEPIGRTLVFRTEQEIRLVDIAMLMEHRGSGIGSSLVGELLAEGSETNRPVIVHVEKSNRAVRLYERLGFAVAGDAGSHFKMEWLPR